MKAKMSYQTDRRPQTRRCQSIARDCIPLDERVQQAYPDALGIVRSVGRVVLEDIGDTTRSIGLDAWTRGLQR